MKTLILVLNNINFAAPGLKRNSALRILIVIAGWMAMGYPQSAICQSKSVKFQPGPVLWNSEKIAGNFGELRGSHFHSGVDIKTSNVEGLPVLAADDGYVVRAKISSSGYGRALYIHHNGNVTTVYGHLRMFFPALEDTLKKLRFSKQQSEVEFLPDSGFYKVKKGDLIAFSGNTGSSEAPHLHFETRHTKSEMPFNPELIGYLAPDMVPPVVKSIVVYEPGPGKGIFGSQKQVLNDVTPFAGYDLDTVVTGSEFFVGVEAVDFSNGNENKIGTTAYEVYIDDNISFVCRIDSFSFDQTGMIKTCIDYQLYQETGQQVMVLLISGGNTLPFYVLRDGIFKLNDSDPHQVKIRIYDGSGNYYDAGFVIRKGNKQKEKSITGNLCRFDKANEIKQKAYSVKVSPGTFYENTWLDVSCDLSKGDEPAFSSPLITLGPAGTPMAEPITVTLKIKPPSKADKSKLVIARRDAKGNQEAIPFTSEHGEVQFQTRSMGTFSMALDTMAPAAVQPSWENDTFTGKRKLFVPVTEDLSGIKNYSCSINNTWVPAYYQSLKKGIILYPEDMPVFYPESQFKVVISDKVNNEKTYQYTLPR